MTEDAEIRLGDAHAAVHRKQRVGHVKGRVLIVGPHDQRAAHAVEAVDIPEPFGEVARKPVWRGDDKPGTGESTRGGEERHVEVRGLAIVGQGVWSCVEHGAHMGRIAESEKGKRYVTFPV